MTLATAQLRDTLTTVLGLMEQQGGFTLSLKPAVRLAVA